MDVGAGTIEDRIGSALLYRVLEKMTMSWWRERLVMLRVYQEKWFY